MKKQLFRRIMALVLAFSMVMSLACTTSFAIGDVDDDGVETLEVMSVEDIPAEEDDVTVPEEEEGASEPEEVPAEEEEPQAEEEAPAPEAEPTETDPVEGEELQGDINTGAGWKAVTNADNTVSYQYWYQDEAGNLVQARDHFKAAVTQDDADTSTGDTSAPGSTTEADSMANSAAYNAFYINTSFATAEGDVTSGYYYFDAEGNCVGKNTWTLYAVTVIDKNGVVTTSDTTHSGIKCLKMSVAVGETGIYSGQEVKSDNIPITAANDKVYLSQKENSTVKKSVSASYFNWHVNETEPELKYRNNVSWRFLPENTDEIGVYGIPLNDYIYFGNIHSRYTATPDAKYCYMFKEGKPANVDNTFGTYYNTSQKKYYAVYFTEAETHGGVSLGYYAAQGKVTTFSDKCVGNVTCYLVSSKGVAEPYTGINNCIYYKKGVKTVKNGWVKVQNTNYKDTNKDDVAALVSKYRGISKSAYAYDYYYFNNSSKCVTGNKKKAPAIDSSDSSSYYYYFDKTTGKLIQNLFTYNTAFKASKMQIICDDKNTNHNATFLLYNSATKKYDIAALQVILSTPSNPNGTSGIAHGTYYLSSLSRRSWLQNKSKTMWFSDLTYINTTSNKRTGFFFHSPAYNKQNFHSLRSGYNDFGRSNTGGCLRLQTGYCQLVASISTAQQKKKQYKYVIVKFGSYSSISPFKRVTQKMIKIDFTKFNYDPTNSKSRL